MMIPAAGSACTFSDTTLGEAIAGIVDWSLILQYSLACSTVAVGWSGYLVGLSGRAIWSGYLVG